MGRLGIGGFRLPEEPPLGPRRQSGQPFPVPLEIVFTLRSPQDMSAILVTRHNRLVGRETVPVSGGWQCCFARGAMAAVAPRSAPRVIRPAQGFTVDAANLPKLRDGTASLRGDAELRFQRHRLVADLPLQTGAAVEIAGQRIEVLATHTQRSALLVRYLAIPSLARTGSSLSLFVGDAARTARIATSVPGWSGAALLPIAPVSWQRNRSAGATGPAVSTSCSTSVRPSGRMHVSTSSTSDAGTLRMPLAIDGIQLQSPGVEPAR